MKRLLPYAKWLIFTGILSILPILFKYATFWLTKENVSIPLLLENGDLHLISCALAVGALGEIIFSTSSDELIFHKIIVGTGSLILVLFTIVLYSQILSFTEDPNHQEKLKLSTESLSNLQIVLYAFAIIFGVWSQIFPEKKYNHV